MSRGQGRELIQVTAEGQEPDNKATQNDETGTMTKYGTAWYVANIWRMLNAQTILGREEEEINVFCKVCVMALR